MSNPQADRLTSQLYHLPSIIARLGLGIAEAQKEFNADYVRSLQLVLAMIKDTLGAPGGAADDATRKAVGDLIASLAPSLYQFTRTTIEFSADLSETKDFAAEAGFSAGFKAVVVKGAMSTAYGYDYRAAARITSVLEAIRPSEKMTEALLSRAEKIAAATQQLPERSKVENEIHDGAAAVFKAIAG